MKKGWEVRNNKYKRKKRRKGIKKSARQILQIRPESIYNALDRALELSGQDWSERQENCV
jgi:hypothetical protein